MARAIDRLRRLRPAATLLLAVAVLTLAGCGDDGSSSDPSSASYDPAETTLKDAGLEVCSEAEKQIPQTISSTPGLVNTRVFFVAKDCMGAETTPNMMAVFQYDSLESVEAAARTVEKAYPRASVLRIGPLVITATGPDAAKNLAAVEEQLRDETSMSTS
jgi:hypothetical protein